MTLHKRRRRTREFRLAEGLEVPLCSRVAARLGSRRVVVVHKRRLPVIRLRQPLREVPKKIAPRRRVAVQVNGWFDVALHDAAVVRVGYDG